MGAGILEAGANIAKSIQSGYDSLGKGLAGGINTAVGEYAKYKEDQAKFDATKKVFKAFEGFLPKEKNPETGKDYSPMADQINGVLNDTTMSTREKIAMAPMLFNIIGNAQQQYGREKVAGIMADSRLDVASTKNQPRPLPEFDATQRVNPLNQVAGQASAEPAPASAAPYIIQRPPAQPQPTSGPLSNMPKTRRDPETGRMQFWSPGAKRYIDETENELLFGPDFRIMPQ